MSVQSLVGLFLTAALATTPQLAVAAAARGPNSAAASSRPQAPALADAERLADWQLGHMPAPMPQLPAGLDPVVAAFARMESAGNARSWHQATFWLGLAELAERSGSPRWRQAILEQGRAAQWQLGERLTNADDHLIGRSYLWAATHGAGSGAIAPLRAGFDRILADLPRTHLALYVGAEGSRGIPKAECLQRWCWADALFMAPATWLELSRATGDRRYRDYAMSEFWSASDFLYDPAERLYFRDSRFFAERDERGGKIFWSRGNGWVLAGIAQMLDALPARDPGRGRLEDHFREFAGRVVKLQKADGSWPPSLLATSDATPETSGTALFTYALAWGIGHGVLPRADYEPTVRRGWQALQAAIQPDGSLGWVQAAGDRPGTATASSNQIYATGAYLLAATAITDLDRKH